MRLLLARSSASQPVPHQKRATLWLMKGYFFLPQGSARLMLKEPAELLPRRSALPAADKSARLRVKNEKRRLKMRRLFNGIYVDLTAGLVLFT